MCDSSIWMLAHPPETWAPNQIVNSEHPGFLISCKLNTPQHRSLAINWSVATQDFHHPPSLTHSPSTHSSKSATSPAGSTFPSRTLAAAGWVGWWSFVTGGVWTRSSSLSSPPIPALNYELIYIESCKCRGPWHPWWLIPATSWFPRVRWGGQAELMLTTTELATLCKSLSPSPARRSTLCRRPTSKLPPNSPLDSTEPMGQGAPR